jgi:hypothetical protein
MPKIWPTSPLVSGTVDSHRKPITTAKPYSVSGLSGNEISTVMAIARAV